MVNRHLPPYFICRKDVSENLMEFVSFYNSLTNDINTDNGDDNKIFYFATADLAVSVFKKIIDKLPSKNNIFQNGWFVRESVKSIEFAISKGRTVMGYVPKKDKIILTTKKGKIFTHVFHDVSDETIIDKMMTIALNGWERYGVSTQDIDKIENINI